MQHSFLFYEIQCLNQINLNKYNEIKYEPIQAQFGTYAMKML